MVTIKRYANRKLYDTGTKKYITLDGVADLIRQGQDVQIVDNVTGEDLTTLTLTQIIMEQERKEGKSLPKNILAALIQVGGESLSTIREKLSSPLELLYQFDVEVDRRIQELIQRGEVAEEAGLKIRDQILEYGHIFGGTRWISERELEGALQKRDIPSREEFQQLVDQVDELLEKISQLQS